ncbi:hypothetical protein ACFWPK_05995 [Nocardia sp. NPDC058519]|uniref:hypothetical protein n=1 Tax=Nocardia sp. NPDC058519 TaxID=3346535 RepID=UPI0036597E53
MTFWGGLVTLLIIAIFGRLIWSLLNVVTEGAWDRYTQRRINREIAALPDDLTE